jgi:quercetin dioxygenase-like cupin family protein
MTVTFAAEGPLIVRAGQGLRVPLAGIQTVHKVRSSITDGRMAIIEFVLPPRHLSAPLHRHSREDEILFVLAGQMGALLGDAVVQARTGAYVVMPRGQWHTFWNASDAELRVMELIVPGGLEILLDRLGPMIGTGGADLSAVERAGDEYGIEFNFENVPAICRQFGVALDHWPRRRDLAAVDRPRDVDV